ncbi:helix-turn-helix domain-containing protein [Metabacillus sp. YM-086]|uniref:helix-turn-helix domain-containing protein n=1 Tax=Metabacillus sp. YM-086 TaxID=3341729 RepID=UPI001B9D58E1
MSNQIPRHNNIGEKIRAKRKEIGMTLGELAKGICSVGKLSNIENGNTPVSNQDLNQFSEKLNTPISYFSDPNINERLREIDYQIQKIKDLIGLKQWHYVEKELSTFKNKIDTYQIKSRDIDYQFLNGIYCLRKNNNKKAEEYLLKVINLEENNNYNLRLKLKAYNAIASIWFDEKRISKSLNLLDRALALSNESPTITKEERDNIYFNLSILYLYIGSYSKALKSINNVNHHLIYPLETEYINLLIRYLENIKIGDIREELLLLREKLHLKNDKEGIFRGWALTIYTIMTSYPEAELATKLKEIFWIDAEMVFQMDEFKETSLSIYQLGIYVLLENSPDIQFIKKLINKSKTILADIDCKIIRSRNFYLEGKFYKNLLNDTNKALSLFYNALDLLENDYEGLLKADILYEICRIKAIESEAMTALELYHGHLESQFLFTHFHELTLPSFKF